MIGIWAAAALTSISPPVLAAAPPGFQGQPFAKSRSFWRTGAKVKPAWFVCAPIDGTDMTVVGLPAARRRVVIAQPLGDSPPGTYRLGRADPGAGQVFWSLSTASGREVGNIHAFNPGALDHPKSATTPTFTSIRISGAQWNCRWLERTRLLGFSTRRVIEITDGPGGLKYQSFDFKDSAKLKRIESGAEQTTTPSLALSGGKESGLGAFVFDNGRYRYRIDTKPAARVTVQKDGRTVSAEPLIAWTIAPPRRVAPSP